MEKEKSVRELCSEIDELIFNIKELVTASSLEVEAATVVVNEAESEDYNAVEQTESK